MFPWWMELELLPAWVSWAVAGVAAIAAFVVIYLIDQTLHAIFSRVPIIGPPIDQVIHGALSAVLDALGYWIDIASQPLTHGLRRITAIMHGTTNTMYFMAQSTLATFTRIRYDGFAWLQQNIGDYAMTLATVVQGNLDRSFRSLVDYVGQEFQGATAYADGILSRAIAYTDQQVGQVGNLLTVTTDSLRQFAVAVGEDVRQLAFGEIQRVETTAQVAIDQVDQRAQQGVRIAEQYAADLAVQAQHYAQILFLDAEQYSDLAVGALGATVATGLGGLGNRITKLENSPCIQECEPLGQLGKELRSIDLLLLLGMVAAMIRYPEPSAEVVATVLSPAVSATIAVTDDVLSLVA